MSAVDDRKPTAVQRLEQLRIRVVSPDGSVAGTLVNGEAITVELLDGNPSPHSGDSLARQVEVVLNGMVAGYGKAVSKVFGQPLGDEFRRKVSRRKSVGAKRLQAAMDQVADIDITESSPTNILNIRYRSGAGFDVEIAGNVPRRVARATLVNELNRAIAKVTLSYARHIGTVHRNAGTGGNKNT